MYRLSILLVAILMSGCITTTGANNTKSHILYEHRTPVAQTAIEAAAKSGLLGKAGIDMNKVVDNAGEVTLGVSEIVRAVTGAAGFPYAVIPTIMSSAFTGASKFKEETADQEVTKLYYTEGMTEISASLEDDVRIEAKWGNAPKSTQAIVTSIMEEEDE